MKNQIITGNLVDIFNRDIYGVEVTVANNRISIAKTGEKYSRFLLPGFIDSHVHIESSMMLPSRFAEAVVPHGTIAVVSDPHEIANVMGEEGVEYMIADSKTVPFKFFFGMPSCVPATSFESAGAKLDSSSVEKYMKRNDIWFLSEMMNFPGVVYEDEEVLKKIAIAKKYGKPIDGHAPGLTKTDLKKYAESGISTDHECSSLNEAIEKIKAGMKIQIREGSAARNFQALFPLFELYHKSIMICTDDSHPDEIIKNGHINRIVKQGLIAGVDLFDLLYSASAAPVFHYNLPVGLLREGDKADFIVVDNLQNFNLLQSYIDGNKVYDVDEGVLFSLPKASTINKFRTGKIAVQELKISLPNNKNMIRVIEVDDGELVTGSVLVNPKLGDDREILSDVNSDILKIVVVNRYNNAPASVGFVKNIGLKHGAIGSTIAHDSHNIIVVGADDNSIAAVINKLIEIGGGIAANNGSEISVMELPVAGLMSDKSGSEVAETYLNLNLKAALLGSTLKAPFMTLSFLSLLVIPTLKLGDKGLFDVNSFSFVSLFE